MARKSKLPPNVRWNAGRKTFELVKRDRRLRGGRVSLSLSTTDRDEAIRRRGDFMTLLEAGRRGVVEALRAGSIHWSDVRRAVRDGDYTELQTSLIPMPTLGEARDAIVADLRGNPNRRPSTADVYEKYLGQLVEHFGADTLLDVPTSDAIKQWMRAPRVKRAHRHTGGKPWSANTQAIVRTVGKRMYDFQIERLAELAEKQKTIPPIRKNPFDAIEAPKESGTRVEFLRPEEWRKLSDRCEGTPEHAIVALGTLAGLRIDEIAHLRVGIDLDMEKRAIRIQARAGKYPWKPKTRRSTRAVPIVAGGELERVLAFHVEKYASDVYLITSAGRDRPLTTQTLRGWVRTAFEAVNIRYGQKEDALTPHSLRHTFASWMVQRDVQLMKVAELMGDTVEEVVKTYAHLLPRDLEVAAGVVDSVARKSAKRTAEDAA